MVVFTNKIQDYFKKKPNNIRLFQERMYFCRTLLT